MKVHGNKILKDADGKRIQGLSINQQAIKMDALWKPIIRKFRQFIKISVMHKLRYQVDETKSIAQLGYLFGEILEVPEDILKEERVQMALYVLIESSKITRDRKLLPDVQEQLKPHCQSVKQNYFNIYFENSSKKRLIFFCEPLVQYLWTIFRNRCANIFREYISEVNTHYQGKEKVIKLVKDAS